MSRIFRRLAKIATTVGTGKLVNAGLMPNITEFYTRGSSNLVHLYDKPAKLCAFGTMQFSSARSGERARQVCIAPESFHWQRLVANLGLLFGTKILGVSSFRNGVSFSTLKKPNCAFFSLRMLLSLNLSITDGSSKTVATGTSRRMRAGAPSKSPTKAAKSEEEEPSVLPYDADGT